MINDTNPTPKAMPAPPEIDTGGVMMATEVRDETLVFEATDFLGWLDTKQTDDAVGWGLSFAECPVSAWLNETRPTPEPEKNPWWVGMCLVGYDSYHYCPLPVWMVLFTRRLDALYARKPITVAMAKEVLAEVLG